MRRVIKFFGFLFLVIALYIILPQKSEIPTAKAAPHFCYYVTAIPESECYALSGLYSTTDGDNWDDNTNWMIELDPCDWYGVYCNTDTPKNVTEIVLSSNSLNGTIPNSIDNLTELEGLYLQYNQLSGSIPSDIGSLSNLDSLTLNANQLTGSIPPELGNLSLLTRLNLDDNLLTGSIPTELGNLSSLEYLFLGENQLSGSIPTQLGNLSLLQVLDLQQNLLSGSIPSQIGNLAVLRDLHLAENDLTGSIPTELGNLTQLQSLHLEHNSLSGSIPSSIGNLTLVQYLILNNNNLTGTIPTTIENLTSLDWLYLNQNDITGRIPNEITALTLEWLNLNTTLVCEPQEPAFQTWASTNVTTFLRPSTHCPYYANPLTPATEIYDPEPEFTWEEDHGATEYRFYLNDSSGNLVNTWIDEATYCVSGTCTYSTGLNLAYGNYSWAIQTRNSIETGPWSEYESFNLGSEPVSPSGRINDVRGEYTWTEWEGADDYRLFVSHAAVGTVINEWYEATAACTGGTCAAISDVHLQTGNHSFTFQARSDDMTIDHWSSYLSFKLLNDTPPSATIVPIGPTGDEITTPNPTYSWYEVGRASWYKVFIGSNTTGKVYNAYHRAAEVCYGTLCQITPVAYLLSGSPVSALEYDIGHHWFVMPVNVAGNGSWSAAQNFQVEPAP